jgi:hypothetical protein
MSIQTHQGGLRKPEIPLHGCCVGRVWNGTPSPGLDCATAPLTPTRYRMKAPTARKGESRRMERQNPLRIVGFRELCCAAQIASRPDRAVDEGV